MSCRGIIEFMAITRTVVLPIEAHPALKETLDEAIAARSSTRASSPDPVTFFAEPSEVRSRARRLRRAHFCGYRGMTAPVSCFVGVQAGIYFLGRALESKG